MVGCSGRPPKVRRAGGTWAVGPWRRGCQGVGTRSCPCRAWQPPKGGVGWGRGQALCSRRAERGRGSKLPGPRRTSTSSAEMPGPGPPFLEPLGTRGVWGGVQRPPLSGHSLHSGRQRCPGCTSRLQPRTLRCTSLRKCCQLGRSAPPPAQDTQNIVRGSRGTPDLGRWASQWCLRGAGTRRSGGHLP